jgi:hypothetical protein
MTETNTKIKSKDIKEDMKQRERRLLTARLRDCILPLAILYDPTDSHTKN